VERVLWRSDSARAGSVFLPLCFALMQGWHCRRRRVEPWSTRTGKDSRGNEELHLVHTLDWRASDNLIDETELQGFVA
jgi:hypothetical protein